MILPQENKSDKREIIKELKELCEKYRKNKWMFRKKNWFFRNYKYILVILGLVGLFIIIPAISIYISIQFFKVPIEMGISSSFIFSILAFLISISTLLINVIRFMDFPIDDLTYKQLNSKENFFELQFSIKNCGHGKLKLKFASYFIESLNKNGDLNEFLMCENLGDYLKKLIKRISENKIKTYSLKTMTKKYGAYFTHDDIHVETRIHKFDEYKIYLITFIFLTSHRVFFYISKYLIPKESKKIRKREE